jgi:hypothetical protein
MKWTVAIRASNLLLAETCLNEIYQERSSRLYNISVSPISSRSCTIYTVTWRLRAGIVEREETAIAVVDLRGVREVHISLHIFFSSLCNENVLENVRNFVLKETWEHFIVNYLNRWTSKEFYLLGYIELYGVTSRKIDLFMTNAVRSSNPALYLRFV